MSVLVLYKCKRWWFLSLSWYANFLMNRPMLLSWLSKGYRTGVCNFLLFLVKERGTSISKYCFLYDFILSLIYKAFSGLTWSVFAFLSPSIYLSCLATWHSTQPYYSPLPPSINQIESLLSNIFQSNVLLEHAPPTWHWHDVVLWVSILLFPETCSVEHQVGEMLCNSGHALAISVCNLAPAEFHI